MNHTEVVLVTLIAYKLLLAGIGVAAHRRTRDTVDFFLAGRKLGPLVASISASASSSSAWTLLGVSGAAYGWGLSAVWIFPACVGGFLINWFILAERLREHSYRSGAVTLTDVLAASGRGQKNLLVAATASSIILISLVTYVASQFQGAGKAFQETFGVSGTTSILVGAGVVLAYTLLGGFLAVSLTDTLQGLVMAATAVVLPLAALAAVGGWSGLVEGLHQVPDPGYLSLTQGLPGAAALGFILGTLGIGFGYPGQPHVVNRFMALESGKTALIRARRIALGWAVIIYAGMLLLGWCGRVLYPGLADREVVFITATGALLPPLLAGIAVAAVLSAIMSTADSQLLVAASSIAHDLRRDGAARFLLQSRVTVTGLCLVAVVAAIFGGQQIFSRVLFAWTAMGAAFGPLLLVLLFKGPIPADRRLASMLCGFGISVLAYSFPETRGGVVERVLPFAAALLVALIPVANRKAAAVDSPREMDRAG